MTQNDVTPDTFVIRQVWKNMTRRPDVALAEFDRWLASVQAQAWDEGLDAGRDRWMDAREFGQKPVNPYRPLPDSAEAARLEYAHRAGSPSDWPEEW